MFYYYLNSCHKNYLIGRKISYNGNNYVSLKSLYHFLLKFYKSKMITLNFFLKKDKILAKVAMFLCAPVFILLYLYDDIL